MKLRRHDIKRTIILVTFTVLMLCAFPSNTNCDMNREKTNNATTILEEGTAEIDMDELCKMYYEEKLTIQETAENLQVSPST